MNFLVAKLQYSKDDISYSLHAEPTSFSLSGLQRVDLLATLGFSEEVCPFVASKKCLANWIPADFPLSEFAKSFPDAFSELESAETHLTRFGLLIPGRSPTGRSHGDGHTSPSSKELKEAEDENFHFVLSWIEGPNQKGWAFHYRPRHPPLSLEVKAAFEFLELPFFQNCPYFEFEECNWQFFPFRSDDRSFTGSNVQLVHDAFGQLASHFSPGIEALVKCHSLLASFGFSLLEVGQPVYDEAVDPSQGKEIELSTLDYEFDVAISFAGPQRPLAEQLAELIRMAGFTPFFDAFYPEQLWGKDLFEYFDEIYRKKARYCVIFISKEYKESMWTTHERKSAQARALEERGKEYILPVRIDDTELPGLLPTIGYLSIEEYPIKRIAEILVVKMQGS